MSDNNQGAGTGLDPENIQQSQNQDQGQQGGYDSIRQSQGETEDNMGGGYGSHGSGVAGGYEGSSNQQSTQEKQDWLDKGISSVGQKLGVNINQNNADKAGDFLNKEVKERAGRNLPGVQ